MTLAILVVPPRIDRSMSSASIVAISGVAGWTFWRPKTASSSANDISGWRPRVAINISILYHR